jgi:hypothetical protein
MEIQPKTTVTSSSAKSLHLAVKTEIASQPQITKLEPMTPYLAEMVARRSSNYFGRGIPYSPLND